MTYCTSVAKPQFFSLQNFETHTKESSLLTCRSSIICNQSFDRSTTNTLLYGLKKNKNRDIHRNAIFPIFPFWPAAPQTDWSKMAPGTIYWATPLWMSFPARARPASWLAFARRQIWRWLSRLAAPGNDADDWRRTKRSILTAKRDASGDWVGARENQQYDWSKSCLFKTMVIAMYSLFPNIKMVAILTLCTSRSAR